MFGIGKVHGLDRKEWNTCVRNILEARLSIDTNHRSNPLFPGLLVFGEMLDTGWHQKACPEDNALYIALAYVVGCAKEGGAALDEARRVNTPTMEFLTEVFESGKISEARRQQFLAYYDKHGSVLK